VLTRRRDGSQGAEMVDVQLQRADTGAIVWAQSFSDPEQADAFERQLDSDLDDLDEAEFRRRYGVPPSS
jgi:hypothetical protein